MPDLIDQYLAELRQALQVSLALEQRVVAEVEAHLREGAEQELEAGAGADEAQRRAIERYGLPEVVARWWNTVHRDESGRATMWERFTEPARRVVYFAQEEAHRLGTGQVGTQHLLLGLLRQNDSAAARLLQRLGIQLGRIRSHVERQVRRGPGHTGKEMQLTPPAKQAIDFAYEEARRLDCETIGTEHLLLGLLREEEERSQVEGGGRIVGQGVLEILPEGWGFLRRFDDFAPSPNDVYVSQSQIQRFGLKSGDWLSGRVRPPQEEEKYYGLLHLETVNHQAPEFTRDRPDAGSPDGPVLLELGLDLARARAGLAASQDES